MTTLTEKFTGLESLLVDQNTALLTALTSLNSGISSINTSLDLIIENNAANTRYLLNAIGQIDPCKPCPLPMLPVPPIDTTEQPLNSSKCKRAQGIIHAIHTLLGYGDLMINGGVFTNPSAVYDALGQAITALGNPDTTPLPSWTETVTIAADIANYIVNNVVNGYTFVSRFEPMEDDLLSVIFSAADASSARSAYEAYIDTHADPSYAKPILKQIAYTALWNYYFDPASTPDLSGYSGSDCAPSGEGCTALYSGGTFTGTDTTGPLTVPICDYVRVGCAGGGGGTIGIYFDGAFRDSVVVDPGGHDKYFSDIPDEITVVGASTDDYFLVVAYCFGTQPSDD